MEGIRFDSTCKEGVACQGNGRCESVTIATRKGAGMNFDSITHVCANGIVVGAILGWIPAAAAFVTLTYYAILIGEKVSGVKCSEWFRKK